MQQRATPLTPPTATAAPPAWAWLITVGLMLVSGYAGGLGSPYLDPVRDIYWAHRIAAFAEWPLVGPEIGFFTHLGPAWYYLLAPALWVDASFTAVAVWAGLLQGSQFVLALVLGRALGHWRFGLLLALLLALPGLHSFVYQSFNHFNLVPAAVLGLLLVAWQDRQHPTPRRALVLGLVFSLMLHAHPATLALGWIPLIAWLWAPRRALRLVLLAVGALLPFLPLLLAMATQRLPETPTGGALAHLGEHFDIQALTATPALLWHTLVGGTHHGLVLVTQGASFMRPALTAGLFLLILLALAGLPALVAPKHRRDGMAAVVLVALAGILTQTVAALLMRAETLWYMVLAVPTLSLVVLAALLAAIEWPPLRRLALPLTAAVSLASLASLLVTLLVTADDNGRRHFPAAFMMNLQAGAAAGVSHPGPQLSFRGSDRLARALCAVSGPLVLHGAVAQQADTLTDLTGALHCPNQALSAVIGGQPETDLPRWLAVGPRIAAAIDRPAEGQLESLHFHAVGEVLHPARSEPLARARDYPPRPRLPADPEIQRLRFTTPCGEWLVVSNPYPWWAPMAIESVSANDQPLQAVVADSVSRLYRFDACQGETRVRWQVNLRAPTSLPPDIVTIAGSPGVRPALPEPLRNR